VTETVFDGGKRGALTAQARAAYDEGVANYRQTVLAAFQNVEDELAALRLLEAESQRQDRAVAAARDSVRITTTQYKAGIVSYLNVVIDPGGGARRTSAPRSTCSAAAWSRACCSCIALGGGWTRRRAAGPAGARGDDRPGPGSPPPA
jgi:hypothetical protein